ncbi:MAG: GerMN domain-containing protein [Anaerolineales bacterium]|nr:GerMN domain-containing protein [Anaerolineales bacterium]
MCAQAVVPFEEVIPLDVSGLPPGQYTVNVNGLVDSFTLPPANGPAAAPPPEPVEPLPTPTPLSPGQGGFTHIQIYLVALGDNGQSGQKIGCDDSLIAVEREITPTIAPLRASLNELLSLREQYDGQSGLYNTLYQSELKIDDIGLANGLATIYLSGRYTLGGVCDIPRFEAQLEATALQFSTVDRVMIFLNGQAMKDALSLAGTPGTPSPGN